MVIKSTFILYFDRLDTRLLDELHCYEKNLKRYISKGRDNYVESSDGELEGDGDGPPGGSRVGQVEVEQSACAAQP